MLFRPESDIMLNQAAMTPDLSCTIQNSLKYSQSGVHLFPCACVHVIQEWHYMPTLTPLNLLFIGLPGQNLGGMGLSAPVHEHTDVTSSKNESEDVRCSGLLKKPL